MHRRESGILQNVLKIANITKPFFHKEIWSHSITDHIATIAPHPVPDLTGLCRKSCAKVKLVGWLVWFWFDLVWSGLVFYSISTFLGYLTANPFLYKYSVLFQTIQFSMSTQFYCQNISISNYSIYSNSFNPANSV